MIAGNKNNASETKKKATLLRLLTYTLSFAFKKSSAKKVYLKEEGVGRIASVKL